VRIQLHASCAARDDAGVLLLGPSGCGKSDLLLRLIDRGFVLVADDRVDIRENTASAPPGLEGLVEMRGLGILRLAHRASVRLVLVCELGIPPPRLPRPARHELGLPLLRLDARPPSAPLLVSHALDCTLGRTGLHVGAFA
jgi:HPr kinase/phosphorylase